MFNQGSMGHLGLKSGPDPFATETKYKELKGGTLCFFVYLLFHIQSAKSSCYIVFCFFPLRI